jgi:hypothetical protein
VAFTYEVWRRVDVNDEPTSTWELLARFPNAKRARMQIHEMAGRNIVSAEDNLYWYEDLSGEHFFRIEVTQTPAADRTE